VKVGVIGCGYWGPNLIRNLFASGRCEAVYCYDAAPKALHHAVGRFPSVIPASSLEEIIEHCDAVMIATPVKSHSQVAYHALSAKKGVFVEKPLTSSLLEGQALVELAARKRLALMTGHTFLYSPAVRKIREYVSSGALGEIFSLSSSRVNLGITGKM
jgi:predicted dehydrogenase